MGRPVSFASCSRMCRVGFGVCENAVFRISSCLALIVVLGPRRFEPAPLSSGLLFSVCESRISASPSSEFWSSESSWPVLESCAHKNQIKNDIKIFQKIKIMKMRGCPSANSNPPIIIVTKFKWTDLPRVQLGPFGGGAVASGVSSHLPYRAADVRVGQRVVVGLAGCWRQ
jgi:hypothetical protein